MIKKTKTVLRITLAALIILSLCCTTSYASDEYIRYYMATLFNQNITYGQYADGSEYMYYGVVGDADYQELNNKYVTVDNDLIYGLAEAAKKSVKYLYIPIYSGAANAYDYYMVLASTTLNHAKQLKISAVDTIYNGVATPATYNQFNATGTITQENWTRTQGAINVYPLRFSINPGTAKADFIRITLNNQTVFGSLIIGMYDIKVIGSAGSAEQLHSDFINLNQNITNTITQIQQQGQEISNAIGNSSNEIAQQIQQQGQNIQNKIDENGEAIEQKVQQLTNTTIKYGEDANYYLDAIAYATDGQKLQVTSVQQHFSTALQAINAQQQIMHNNVLQNAPSEQQVNNNISIDNIAPDMDVSIIGAGSSDKGIGIILNDTRVIAMLVMVFGIATLSYLLFGRKT